MGKYDLRQRTVRLFLAAVICLPALPLQATAEVGISEGSKFAIKVAGDMDN